MKAEVKNLDVLLDFFGIAPEEGATITFQVFDHGARLGVGVEIGEFRVANTLARKVTESPRRA